MGTGENARQWGGADSLGQGPEVWTRWMGPKSLVKPWGQNTEALGTNPGLQPHTGTLEITESFS